MRYLFLLVVIGWVAVAGTCVYEGHCASEDRAERERACRCGKGAITERLSLSGEAPLAQELVDRATVRLRTPGEPAVEDRLDAPKIRSLRLEVSHPNSELTLDAALPANAAQLAFLFEAHRKDLSGHEHVEHALALAPVGQLADLGKLRCQTALPLQRDDRVTVAVAAVDAAGVVGQATQLEVSELGYFSDECERRRHPGHGFLTMLAAAACLIATVVVGLIALIVHALRRPLFGEATAEPISLGQLHRLCSTVLRAHRAYAALGLLCSAMTSLYFPPLAPIAIFLLIFAVVALRYLAMHRLLRLAEQPGAMCERCGPRITVVHGERILIETFSSSAVEAAMCNSAPSMRAR